MSDNRFLEKIYDDITRSKHISGEKVNREIFNNAMRDINVASQVYNWARGYYNDVADENKFFESLGLSHGKKTLKIESEAPKLQRNVSYEPPKILGGGEAAADISSLPDNQAITQDMAAAKEKTPEAAEQPLESEPLPSVNENVNAEESAVNPTSGEGLLQDTPKNEMSPAMPVADEEAQSTEAAATVGEAEARMPENASQTPLKSPVAAEGEEVPAKEEATAGGKIKGLDYEALARANFGDRTVDRIKPYVDGGNIYEASKEAAVAEVKDKESLLGNNNWAEFEGDCKNVLEERIYSPDTDFDKAWILVNMARMAARPLANTGRVMRMNVHNPDTSVVNLQKIAEGINGRLNDTIISAADRIIGAKTQDEIQAACDEAYRECSKISAEYDVLCGMADKDLGDGQLVEKVKKQLDDYLEGKSEASPEIEFMKIRGFVYEGAQKWKSAHPDAVNPYQYALVNSGKFGDRDNIRLSEIAGLMNSFYSSYLTDDQRTELINKYLYRNPKENVSNADRMAGFSDAVYGIVTERKSQMTFGDVYVSTGTMPPEIARSLGYEVSGSAARNYKAASEWAAGGARAFGNWVLRFRNYTGIENFTEPSGEWILNFNHYVGERGSKELEENFSRFKEMLKQSGNLTDKYSEAFDRYAGDPSDDEAYRLIRNRYMLDAVMSQEAVQRFMHYAGIKHRDTGFENALDATGYIVEKIGVYPIAGLFEDAWNWLTGNGESDSSKRTLLHINLAMAKDGEYSRPRQLGMFGKFVQEGIGYEALAENEYNSNKTQFKGLVDAIGETSKEALPVMADILVGSKGFAMMRLLCRVGVGAISKGGRLLRIASGLRKMPLLNKGAEFAGRAMFTPRAWLRDNRTDIYGYNPVSGEFEYSDDPGRSLMGRMGDTAVMYSIFETPLWRYAKPAVKAVASKIRRGPGIGFKDAYRNFLEVGKVADEGMLKKFYRHYSGLHGVVPMMLNNAYSAYRHGENGAELLVSPEAWAEAAFTSFLFKYNIGSVVLKGAGKGLSVLKLRDNDKKITDGFKGMSSERQAQIRDVQMSSPKEQVMWIDGELKALAAMDEGTVEFRKARREFENAIAWIIRENGEIIAQQHNDLKNSKEYAEAIRRVEETARKFAPVFYDETLAGLRRDEEAMTGAEAVAEAPGMDKKTVEKTEEKPQAPDASRSGQGGEGVEGNSGNNVLYRFTEDRDDFETIQKRAVKERGIVMPGLREKVVRVVDVPRHDFEGDRPISEARRWAKDNIIGEHTVVDSNSNEIEYSISNEAVNKYLSRSAAGKSENIGVHLAALKKLPEIISESIEAEVHPDYNKDDNKVRSVDNSYNSERLIHRFYGAIAVEGQIHRVKTTIIESRGAKLPNSAYTYEVTKIELLPIDNNSKVELKVSRELSGVPLEAANLLNGVEKSYDPGVKLLDVSQSLTPLGRQRGGKAPLNVESSLREMENKENLKPSKENNQGGILMKLRNAKDRLIEAISRKTGKSFKEVKEEIKAEKIKNCKIVKELYDKILRLEFNKLTLQKIYDYVSQPNTEINERNISQRLPQEVERGLHARQREDGIDALFSRAAERAVPPADRKSSEGKRRIEEAKKEIVRAYAKAAGCWYEKLEDIPGIGNTQIADEGKDAKVYLSSDGESVIKVKRGKPFGKRFRADLDDISLFNHVFKNTQYEIIGYGDMSDGVSTIVRQPLVQMSEKPVSIEERVEYMRSLGFEPINKENTAFSNGEIIAADIQGKNIIRDIYDNIRVIDADMKLHLTSEGGRHSYPEVENDYLVKSTDKEVSTEGTSIPREAQSDRGDETTSLRHYEASAKSANAESFIREIERTATETARIMGVEVEIDHTVKGKGSYDPATGKVRINPSMHTSAEDVRITMLHEVAGHKGLHNMLGKDYTSRCAEIFAALSPMERARFIRDNQHLKDKSQWEQGAEYMASVAEKMTLRDNGRLQLRDSEYNRLREMWAQFVGFIRERFRKFGLKITEADIRYMIARGANKENLRREAEKSHDTMQDAVQLPELFRNDFKGDTPYMNDRMALTAEEYAARLNETTFGKANNPTRTQRMSDNFVDDMAPVARVMAKMNGISTREAREMNGYNNPYMLQESAASRTMDRINRLRRNEMKETTAIMGRLKKRIMDSFGIKDGNEAHVALNTYLISTTGLERQKRHIDNIKRKLADNEAALRQAEDDLANLDAADPEFAEKQKNLQKTIDQCHETAEGLGKDLGKDFAGLCASARWLSAFIGEKLKLDAIDWETEALKKNRRIHILTLQEHDEILQSKGYPSIEEMNRRMKRELEDENLTQGEKHDVDKLWEITRGMSDEMLAKQVDTGLMSKESYQRLRYGKSFSEILEDKGFGRDEGIETATDIQALVDAGYLTSQEAAAYNRYYEYYLPLKGNAEVFDITQFDTAVPVHASGSSRVRGVKGHRNMSADPISQLFHDLMKTHMQANDNEWKRELYRMCQEYNRRKGHDNNIVRTHESEVPVRSLESLVDAPRMTKGLEVLNDNAVQLYDDGRLVAMVFADQRIGRAINEGTVKPGEAGKMAAKLTRFLANTVTSWSVSFQGSNLIRDFISQMEYVFVKGIKGKKDVKDPYGHSRKFIFSAVRNELMGKHCGDEYIHEYFTYGGRTALNQLGSKAELETKLRKLSQNLSFGARTGRMWQGVWGSLELMGNIIENRARASAYRYYRLKGLEIAEAVHRSKEVTVNFDRRGRYAPYYGLVQMFLNATIQGNRRNIELLKGNPLRYLSWRMAHLATSQLMMPVLGYVIYNLLSDDEEEKSFGDYCNEYYSINDYTRSSNLVLPFGEDMTVTIPDALDNKPWNRLGGTLMKSYLCDGNDRETALRDAYEVTGSFVDLLGFEPMSLMYASADPSDRRRWWHFMASNPVIAPIIDVAGNTNYMGAPLHYDERQDDVKPRHEFDRNKNTLGHYAARFANEATKFDDTSAKGAIDMSGANIDRFMQSFGGMFNDMLNGITGCLNYFIGDKDVKDEEKRTPVVNLIRNIPIANRFVRQGMDSYAYADQLSNYIDEKKKGEEAEKTFGWRVNNGRVEEAVLSLTSEDWDNKFLYIGREKSLAGIDDEYPQWARDYAEELRYANWRRGDEELSDAEKVAEILGRAALMKKLLPKENEMADADRYMEKMEVVRKAAESFLKSGGDNAQYLVRLIDDYNRQRKEFLKLEDGEEALREIDKAIIYIWNEYAQRQ